MKPALPEFDAEPRGPIPGFGRYLWIVCSLGVIFVAALVTTAPPDTIAGSPDRPTEDAVDESWARVGPRAAALPIQGTQPVAPRKARTRPPGTLRNDMLVAFREGPGSDLVRIDDSDQLDLFQIWVDRGSEQRPIPGTLIRDPRPGGDDPHRYRLVIDGVDVGHLSWQYLEQRWRLTSVTAID